MNDTKASHRKLIQSLAADGFAAHELIEMASTPAVRMWKCSRKGSWNHGFFVVIAPTMVMVYGDTPLLVLRPYSESDPLPWLINAIDSPDYLLSKAENKTYDFLKGEALAEIAALREENPKAAEAVLEEFNQYEIEGDFYRAWHENVESDVPGCRDLSSDMWWGYHALATFCRLLPVVAHV